MTASRIFSGKISPYISPFPLFPAVGFFSSLPANVYCQPFTYSETLLQKNLDNSLEAGETTVLEKTNEIIRRN